MGFTRISATTFCFVIETALTPSARGMPLFSTFRAATGPTPRTMRLLFLFFDPVTSHLQFVTPHRQWRIIRLRRAGGNAAKIA